MTLQITFEATIIKGSGRGKDLGIPTYNLALEDVSRELDEGIYACFASLGDGAERFAAMHYGPRPVFHDSLSCEVHLLEEVNLPTPEKLNVRIIERLRDVADFTSPEELMKQIDQDIQAAHAILRAYDEISESTDST